MDEKVKNMLLSDDGEMWELGKILIREVYPEFDDHFARIITEQDFRLNYNAAIEILYQELKEKHEQRQEVTGHYIQHAL